MINSFPRRVFKIPAKIFQERVLQAFRNPPGLRGHQVRPLEVQRPLGPVQGPQRVSRERGQRHQRTVSAPRSVQSQLNKVGHSQKSKQTQAAPKVPLMTSQLRHNFLASQAVHGADDVTTLHFKSQVNYVGV